MGFVTRGYNIVFDFARLVGLPAFACNVRTSLLTLKKRTIFSSGSWHPSTRQ
jgi:hypothetical protein